MKQYLNTHLYTNNNIGGWNIIMVLNYLPQ